MARKGAYLVPTLVTYCAIDELGRKLGFPEASQRKVSDVLDAGLRLARDLPRGRRARSASAPICSARRTSSRAASSRSAREATVAGRGDPLGDARERRDPEPRGELGVLAPGARADLLVVEGDPLRDIALLEGQGKHLAVILRAGELS